MRQSIPNEVSSRQRLILEKVRRSKRWSQELVTRCRIVLMSAAGKTNASQAIILGVDRQLVRRWRHRWAESADALAAAEAADTNTKKFERDYEKMVLAVLSDEYRSGAPAKFSAEQVVTIISLACEPPADSGLPVSHWTPSELAREAQKRGIVASISARHVDRFLARPTCDLTRVNTGSPRRTNKKTPPNTKLMSKESATPTATRVSLQKQAGTS